MGTRELDASGAFEYTPEVRGGQRGLFVSPLQEEPFLVRPDDPSRWPRPTTAA
ncbi:hypothetical protein AB5J72_27275 [Streptomyces sp. CG1]|uniref:hypothetical protein n=1 Tax=Streptomyces sp. CG1 TaxID=1287523 RepID=UPI0034E23766